MNIITNNNFKYIFRIFGVVLFYLFPNKIITFFMGIFRNIYSGYKLHKVYKSESNSILFFPVTLIGEKYITIGKNSSVGKRGVITAYITKEYNTSIKIQIGDNVLIGDDCHITAINSIVIDDNVLMGKKITITDNSHGNNIYELNIHPAERLLFSKGSVIINKNVWIGDKVTILPGVTVGESSVIGANSVVTKNVPAFCIAAGNPAKIIKQIL